MKWTQFIIKERYDNEIIMLNTLNAAVVKLTDNEYNYLNKFVDKSENNIENNLNDTINELCEMQYLLDDNYNEKAKYMDIVEEEYQTDSCLSVTVMPTFACNFHCKYCYEAGIDRNVKFNEELFVKIPQLIENRIMENENIKYVNVNLFGGEPTVRWDIVERLLPDIAKVCQRQDVEMYTEIVTNGYEFDKQKLDTLIGYNLKSVQITLDGPENTHNARRNINNKNNSFKKIIENIHNIVEQKEKNPLLQMNLRINCDKENYEEIEKLLIYLSKEYDATKINLSFGLISDTIKESDATSYIDDKKISDSIFCDTYISFFKMAKKLGFKMSYLFSFDTFCISKMKNALIIAPDGALYKCISMVGRKECSYGNVINDDEKFISYFNPQLYDNCFEKKCPLIPLCHCGCRFESYIKNADIYNVTCKQDENIQVIKEILKLI